MRELPLITLLAACGAVPLEAPPPDAPAADAAPSDAPPPGCGPAGTVTLRGLVGPHAVAGWAGYADVPVQDDGPHRLVLTVVGRFGQWGGFAEAWPSLEDSGVYCYADVAGMPPEAGPVGLQCSVVAARPGPVSAAVFVYSWSGRFDVQCAWVAATRP